MVSIYNMERDARHRIWAEAICECKSSGKTVKQWCRDHELSVKTYYYRYKQVRDALGRDFARRDGQGNGSNALKSIGEQPREWLPVQIDARQQNEEMEAVILRIGKCELDIKPGMNLQWLSEIVKALVAAC